MPTAVVTGATGILGREIVHRLGQSPQQWTQVWSLSRSKKESFPSNTKHASVDLCGSTSDMAKTLDGMNPDYVFFAAYLAKDTEQAATDVNGAMLQSFLDALASVNGTRNLKRVILVTGCKQYGVHLGPVKNPMQESDPWLRDESRFPPNFYYRQQDILRRWCEETTAGKVSYAVTYPNDVIGFAKGNFMNLATSIGIYLAVTREMGQEAIFPGSETFYTGFDSMTSASLHAEFCEWAALEPKAANEAFNVVNGDVESYQNLFPRMAAWFGVKVREDQFVCDEMRDLSTSTELNDPPPTVVLEKEQGLKGKQEKGRLEGRVDLIKWSERADVKEAWARLAEREGLEVDAFENATWGFLKFVLGRSYDLVISMSKARAMGWTGYKDTWSAFSETFDELVQGKVLPKSS